MNYFFTEHNILIFLLEIFILLGLARGLGELFRRWGQPPLTAEILAGLLLGPTILGRFAPALYNVIFPKDIIQQSMLSTVAWLGLLFLLLETGLKMDFSSAWRHRGKALTIALTGIAIPLIIGFTFSFLLPSRYLIDPGNRIAFALFMATVMTISAMPITIRALNDLNLVKTDLGFLIMSALSVNEVIGWLIFTLVLGFFIQPYAVVGRLIVISISVVVFIILCMTVGRKFANFVISKAKARNMPEPATSLTFICLLGLFCGAVFQLMGVHALLGFFIAGVMAGEARALPERTRQVISQMVYAIFVPLFFASIGLRIDFFKSFDVFLVLFVSGIGISGKFLGAWLGASFTDLPKVNRLPVAIAHTPGGSMEIIVGILALEYHLITTPMFVAIVFGGVVSSVILGPWLKYSIKKRKKISILEFFSEREVVPQLKTVTRDDIINELCAVASEQGNMPNAESLYRAALARENSLGTAIEEGIAFPHARIPLLVKPVIVFGRSIQGVDWNSPDGNPAHFIFLILTPKEDDEIQIKILRILATAMSNSAMRQDITKAADRSELWNVLKESFMSHQIVRK